MRGRELYIVVNIDEEENWCWIKKSMKQLRSENYKVKTTEICLVPNQAKTSSSDHLNDVEDLATNEEEITRIDDTIEDEKVTEKQQEPVIDTRKYSLRRKPKPDYKSMHEGISINLTETMKPFLLKG